jgi:hypothetical protein
MTWRSRLATLCALGAAACSSYNRASLTADSGATSELPSTDTGTPATADVPTAPTDTGATEGFSCTRLCRRLGMVSGCGDAQRGCTAMCGSEYSHFPTACTTQLEALFQCVENPTTRIVCMAMTYPYQDCMVLNGSAQTCVRNNP